MAIEIPLIQGKVAIIDEEDLELVSRYRWCASKSKNTYYAKTNIRRADGRKTTAFMHRILLGLTDHRTEVDHINGDGLDNRRANLRSCSKGENMRNRGAQENNNSGLKGVCWHKQCGKWQAAIMFDGKQKHLGLYSTPEEAHMAYCRAAKELHGDFANFG